MARIMLLFFIVLLLIEGPVSGESEIVIGVATSLASLEGRDSLMATELAVSEINERGGLKIRTKRRRIRIKSTELSGADPEFSVPYALKRLEKLIKKEKPKAIVVGPFRSEIFLPAMDLVSQEKIPLLGSIAMSPAVDERVLRDRRYRYVFRLGLSSRYLADYLISLMRFLKSEHGVKTVYLFHQDVAWARSLISMMVRLYFDRSEMRIVGSAQYPTGASDFSTGLMDAVEKKADVILPIFDMPQSANLVKQWYSLKSRALLCGFVSPMVGPGAWNVFGEKITGSLNLIFELGNISSSKWAPSLRFVKSFAARFGRPPEAGHGPAPAYESVHVLAEAMKRAGSANPEKIVRQIEKTDRLGVMGRIRFHPGHQVVFGDNPREEAIACVFQWEKDGNRKIVYPLSVAEGRITPLRD